MTMSARKSLGVQRSNGTHEFNIAIVGALGVGKSALTVKYITKRFIMEYDPYLEGTYTKHEDMGENQDFLVHLMDTYDREDSDPARYMTWADAFVVVYSITNRQSFETARAYLENITQYLRQHERDCPVALAANKIDLERYRQVSRAEGLALSREMNCLSFDDTTAAEDCDALSEVFRRLVRKVHAERCGGLAGQALYIEEERPPPTHPLHARTRPKSPKGTADKKDEKNLQKKNFSKIFKIFN